MCSNGDVYHYCSNRIQKRFVHSTTAGRLTLGPIFVIDRNNGQEAISYKSDNGESITFTNKRNVVTPIKSDLNGNSTVLLLICICFLLIVTFATIVLLYKRASFTNIKYHS